MADEEHPTNGEGEKSSSPEEIHDESASSTDGSWDDEGDEASRPLEADSVMPGKTPGAESSASGRGDARRSGESTDTDLRRRPARNDPSTVASEDAEGDNSDASDAEGGHIAGESMDGDATSANPAAANLEAVGQSLASVETSSTQAVEAFGAAESGVAVVADAVLEAEQAVGDLQEKIDGASKTLDDAAQGAGSVADVKADIDGAVAASRTAADRITEAENALAGSSGAQSAMETAAGQLESATQGHAGLAAALTQAAEKAAQAAPENIQGAIDQARGALTLAMSGQASASGLLQSALGATGGAAALDGLKNSAIQSLGGGAGVMDRLNGASQSLTALQRSGASVSGLLDRAAQASALQPEIGALVGKARDALSQATNLESSAKAALQQATAVWSRAGAGLAQAGNNLTGARQRLEDASQRLAGITSLSSLPASNIAGILSSANGMTGQAATALAGVAGIGASLAGASQLMSRATALNQSASRYVAQAHSLSQRFGDPQALLAESQSKLDGINTMMAGGTSPTALTASLATLPVVGGYAAQANAQLTSAEQSLAAARQQVTDALPAAVGKMTAVSTPQDEAARKADEAAEEADRAKEAEKDAPAGPAPADEDEDAPLDESFDEPGGDDPEKIWFYVTSPLDAERRKFGLEKVEGEEHISGLYLYKLTLKTRDEKVDFKKLMGKPVVVHFEYQSTDDIRYINGIVTRLIQADFDGEIVTYYAEIRPWLWQMTLSRDCRIFQNKKVTEIIADVFKELGFADFKDSTTGTYPPREYCVQYGETDFNFISRLMEDEGIFYFFQHTKEKHTLVLADANTAFEDVPGLKSIRLRDVDPEKDDLAESVTFEQELISNKYMATDFNFETPADKVQAKVDGKTTGKLAVYEYPGGFSKTDAGEKVANKRIEELEVPGKVFKGETFVRGFVAGLKFKFSDHYREDYNNTYVVRSLSITATDAQYKNTFEAFPADVVFRPPQKSEKPRIYGTQTATVVGKSGEEIWTDKYGRIMVQFHWDLDGKKNEKSSCWVRVAQVWAGKSWGTFFIPRVGSEAVISFLEGDPDQPLVIGTLYNATQTVPYAQPGEKTKSTIKTNSSKGGGGFNEIRFEDKKDAEEIFIHAQKDMNIKVENDRTSEILNNETSTITKNRTITIKEEHDKLTVSKGNRTVEITEGNETLSVKKGDRLVQVEKGNETHTVKAKRSVTVEEAETHDNKADFTQTVKGDFTLKVDGNLTIDVKGKITIKSGQDMLINSSMKLTEKSGQDMTLKSGMNLKSQAGMNMEHKAGINLKNKAGVNLDNEAGAMMKNKASAMQQVDGGGMLMLKGGLIKIG